METKTKAKILSQFKGKEVAAVIYGESQRSTTDFFENKLILTNFDICGKVI